MSSPSSPSLAPLRRAQSMGDMNRASRRSSDTPAWSRYSIDPPGPRRATTDASPSSSRNGAGRRPVRPSSTSNRTDDVYLTFTPTSNDIEMPTSQLHHHQQRLRSQRTPRMPTLAEPSSTTLPQQNPPAPVFPPGIRGRIRRILVFFGHGPNNHARREFVALIWNMCFGFVQVCYGCCAFAPGVLAHRKSPSLRSHYRLSFIRQNTPRMGFVIRANGRHVTSL